MKTTIEVSEVNFEAEVLKAAEPVVVEFWAPWCGPCRMLAPVLEEVAAESAGRFKVAKVNVDESPGLANTYGIQSIPTLYYFQSGEPKHKSVGAVSKREILGRLEAVAGMMV